MFATFDKSSFPIVKVVFEEGPNSDEEFDNFTNEWLELYNQKINFTFLFDTINMRNPAYKYTIKMSQFIKRLKREEIQYLEKSIILINTNKIKYMLDFIFLIQKPVAPVYIYNINNGPTSSIYEIMAHSETTFISP